MALTQSSGVGSNISHTKKTALLTCFWLNNRGSSDFTNVYFVERQISVCACPPQRLTHFFFQSLQYLGVFQESTFYHTVSIILGSIQKLRYIDNAFRGILTTGYIFHPPYGQVFESWLLMVCKLSWSLLAAIDLKPVTSWPLLVSVSLHFLVPFNNGRSLTSSSSG